MWIRDRYPGGRLRLLNHSTPEAGESVKNGLADFAVVTTPLQAKKPLKSTSLMSFKEIAVGDHSFQGKEKPIRLKDLIENPLISLGQGSTTYEFYSKFFLENDLVLSPDTEVETIDQVLPLIMNGLGIGFLPEPVSYTHLEDAGRVDEMRLGNVLSSYYIGMGDYTTFMLSPEAEKPLSDKVFETQSAICLLYTSRSLW